MAKEGRLSPSIFVGVGGVGWFIAALIGPGFINPFSWWLAFLEAVEFISYLLGGGNMGAFVAAYPSPETVAIAGGWVGIVSWLALGAIFARERAWVPFALNFLFVPILGLIATGLWFRSVRSGEPIDPDTTSAE